MILLAKFHFTGFTSVGSGDEIVKVHRIAYSGDTRSRFPVIPVHCLLNNSLGRFKINTFFLDFLLLIENVSTYGQFCLSRLQQ